MLTRFVFTTLFVGFVALTACGSPEAEAESVTFATARAVAVIEESEGLVRVTRADEEDVIDVYEDMELGQGDRVTTLSDASATISFLDDHLVKLSANTTFLIQEVKPRTVSGALWASVKLLSGRLFASLGELTGEDAGFTVSTPTAVAAVKGTTFSVDAQGEETVVSVLEGEVDAASAIGDGEWGERLRLKPGRESVIRGRMRGRPVAQRLAKARGRIIKTRLKAMRDRVARYREKRKSGELRRMRHLRKMARAGELKQMSPALKRFLEKNPALREKLREHGKRHRKIQEQRAKRKVYLKRVKKQSQAKRQKLTERAKKKLPTTPKRKLPAPKKKLPKLPGRK